MFTPGNKLSMGRPAGSRNKITGQVKETIEMAAQGLGGVRRLIAWAREDPQNERLFWAVIYPKLLPMQDRIPGTMIYERIIREVVRPGEVGRPALEHDTAAADS